MHKYSYMHKISQDSLSQIKESPAIPIAGLHSRKFFAFSGKSTYLFYGPQPWG